MVGTAGADNEMWLRSNLNGGSFTENKSDYLFSKTWDSVNSQDVYELTIGSDKLIANTDFSFRLYKNGTSFETCPYKNSDYTYVFENGQNETYSATSGSDFQGTNSAFIISHSTIKASEYKITVYIKYNEPWEYYIKVDIVTMPLDIKAEEGKATFSCDRALDFSGTGVNAYAITAASDGALTKSTVLTTVPANTGLYIEGPKGTYSIPVIETASASAVGENMMMAGTGNTVYSTSGDNTNFILTNKTVDGAAALKFYKASSSGNTVNKGKAYLQIPTVNVGARESFWFDDDETTGIRSIDNRQLTMDVPMYNLAGKRAKENYKGVVIQNGKKYIVK